jgi:hypothetical protein
MNIKTKRMVFSELFVLFRISISNRFSCKKRSNSSLRHSNTFL